MALIADSRAPFALTIVVAALAWACPVLNVSAETGNLVAPQFEGRWIDQARRDELVLDISPCGQGWCGVKVTQGACGNTALRVNRVEPTPHSASIDSTGKLELAAGAQPYFVKVRVWRTAEAQRLQILGDTRSDFSPMRRWYPFTAHMVRGGDAQCRADAKTS